VIAREEKDLSFNASGKSSTSRSGLL